MFKEITIIIVTFNSDHNIFKLLKKLPKKIKILIVENSNRHQFKKNVEVLSKNIHCILTGSNIGYGRANNIGIRYSKTNYVLILNPDASIDEKVIKQLYYRIKKEKKIAAITCESVDGRNKISKNYYFNKFSKLKKDLIKKKGVVDVDHFTGSMFLAKKKILKKAGLFDENFFLNFEEIDLFKKIFKLGYRVCIEKGLYFKHLKGSSAKPSIKYKMDISSKWHYNWGLIYFFKKNYGLPIALLLFIKEITINLLKLIYFFLKQEKKKFYFIYYSILGLINSIIGKKSFYRPEI